MLTKVSGRLAALVIGTVLATAPLLRATDAPAATGKMQGIIMDHDTNSVVPHVKVKLLAPKGEPDKDGWVKIDDLKTSVTTSDKGDFVFDRLAAGKYVLMVEFSTPMGTISMAAVRQADGKQLIITVGEGKAVDIGKGWVQKPR